MKLILFIVVLILVVIFPALRCALFNPHFDIFYGFKDSFFYFRHKMYNVAPTGVFRIYTGEFGKGKTLSAVHYCLNIYKRYDGSLVWNKELKKFVKQHIIIVSNVQLNIPYIPFTSFSQFINPPSGSDGDRNVYLFLCDEFSVIANSRDYQNNFSTELLMSLLTCRHSNMSLIITSQRFNLIDKILRDNAREVIDCHKAWRFQVQNFYNGWELENCTNPTLVKPILRSCWFVRDKDYSAYDTMAMVSLVKKKIEQKDYLTDLQVLSLRGDNSGDSVEHYSKIARRRKPNAKKYSS